MRILFFANHLTGKDGWSVNALNTIEPFLARGHDCLVFVNFSDSSLNIRQMALLRKPLFYLKNPLFVFWDFFKILKQVRREKPDVIHFLVEPYAFFAFFLKFFYPCKYVLTVCGTYAVVPYFKIRSRFLAILYYRALDLVIAISDYTAGRLLAILPRLKNKVIVIPCGIKLFPVSINRDKKTENKIASIVFIGQVKERKGVLEMLQALSQYKQIYGRNFLFSIIGGYDARSEYYQILRRYVDKNGLSGQVQFCGILPEADKEQYLREADLFMMLSQVRGDNFEGFGLVYLEANQWGVPVIGPNDSGTTTAIKNNFSGYTVDSHSPTVVAEKIYQIIDLNTIAPENCLVWAKEHDRDSVIKIFIDQYRKLTKRD